MLRAHVHSSLGPPMSITNQEDALGQHDGDIFSIEICLSQRTLLCVKLTKLSSTNSV